MRVTSPAQARKVVVKKSDVEGFLAFGPDNLYPQQLVDVCDNSVTATSCLAVRAEFIEGNGFKDKSLWPLVVNRSGETMDGVLNELAQYVAVFEVIALHIGYNGLGKIASIRAVAPEIVRLATPDDQNNIVAAGLFPFLDSDYFRSRKKEFTKLPLFNPDPEVVLQQIADAGGIQHYKGQLLFKTFKRPGDGYYHRPSWHSAIMEILTEGDLSVYDRNTVRSGFNISGMLTILDNDSDHDADYNPLEDESSIEYQIAQAQGVDAGTVLVNRVKSKDQFEATKFEALTGTELSKRYESTSGRIEQHIARAMQVPAELAQVRRSGNALFQSALEQQMAYAMMQKKVNRYQQAIKRELEGIFQHWKEPIPITDFGIENLSFDTVNTDTATAIQ